MLKLVLSSLVVLRHVDGWPSIFWPFKLIVAHRVVMLDLVLSSLVVLRRVDGWPSIFWPFKLIVRTQDIPAELALLILIVRCTMRGPADRRARFHAAHAAPGCAPPPRAVR